MSNLAPGPPGETAEAQADQVAPGQPATGPKVDLGALPPREEAQRTRVATTEHIPKAVRAEWAKTMTYRVARVMANPNNLGPCLFLYPLPHCILPGRETRVLWVAGQLSKGSRRPA